MLDNENEVKQDASQNNDPVVIEVIPEKVDASPDPKKVEDDARYKQALKRIDTLTRNWREEQEARQQDRQVLSQLAQRLQANEKSTAAAEKSSVEVMEQDLVRQSDLAKTAFENAYDTGDKKGMIAAQEALSEAKAKSAVLKMQKVREPAEEPSQRQVRSAPVQQEQRSYNGKAVQWARSQSWWNQDEEATAAAYGIDQVLTRSGWDPTSDEYYEELTKRHKRRYPELYDEGQKDEDEPPAKPQKQTVSGSSRQQPTQVGAGTKVRLTQDELRTAQRLGVSPVEYAKQKALLQEDGNALYAEITI